MVEMIVYNEEKANCIIRKNPFEEIFVVTENISSDDSIKFENTFVCLQNIKTTDDILCNHNLIVLGNIKAKKIIVKEELICLGKIDVEEIEVGQDILISKEGKFRNVKIGGNALVRELEVENFLHVQKDLYILNSGFLDGNINANETIFCGEGILGDGDLSAKIIIAKDYCDVSIDKGHYLLLEELEREKSNQEIIEIDGLDDNLLLDISKDSKSIANLRMISQATAKIIKLVDTSFETIEESMEFEEIEKRLEIIAQIIPYFQKYHECFSKILELSSIYHQKMVLSLEEFLSLLDLKKKTPQALLKISIVHDILISFLDQQKKKCEFFDIKEVNKEQLLKSISTLEEVKKDLTLAEYEVLYKKLVRKISFNGSEERGSSGG